MKPAAVAYAVAQNTPAKNGESAHPRGKTQMTEMRRNWHGQRIQKLEPGERYSVFVHATPSGTLPDIGDRVRARGRRGAEWIGTIAAVRMTREDGAWVVLAEPPPWVDAAAVAEAEREALLALRQTKTREQAGVCVACGEPAEPECPCVTKERERAAAQREARLEQQAADAKETAAADAAAARARAGQAALAGLDDLPADEVRAIIEGAGYDLQAAGEKLGLIEYKRGGIYSAYGTRKTVWTQLKSWLKRSRNAAWAPEVLRKVSQAKARKAPPRGNADPAEGQQAAAGRPAGRPAARSAGAAACP